MFFIFIEESRNYRRPLMVYYGWAKLTKKATRKKQLVVLYENTDANYERKFNALRRCIYEIVHERQQTEEEQEDAQYSYREWTRYGFFLDDKRFKGDLELLLQQNFDADSNHVSLEERETIRNKMREAYYRNYKI